MRETDQFVQEFEKHYSKDKFLRLQVVRNTDKSTTTMYIEQSSGKMVSCKKSHKIFDMKLLTNQELHRFMKQCMTELPIETYTVDSVS
ncbi:hypothetical protein [Companilactobacillus sp.]|nr:hypothetical protein [Companilactobacillus sp.]MCH4008511.1 hypothetical protein [Companilactobacillus sp.]MCH4051310.1 hypothetical protein [Companilactobacillus sp.]MCH4076454.1 hypothetical protein [Companilactobacillus sp.]MCH4125029.1 hypothetical protein [Companilactobacillus sp.]MCH4131570.1 hypothetical protein [Companilactobacillus sp.]